MSRVCLDTSAYSHFKRGDAEVTRAVTEARSVFVPSVVLGELRVGFRLGSREAENEATLREFLAEPVVRVLCVDDDAASSYADLVVELRRSGTPLPTNDIWIAALALCEGATVLTYDAHFEAIPRIGKRVFRG